MLCILSTLLVASLSSPSITQDTIRQLSGEKIVGTVVANKQHFVEFTYPNESSVNSLPKTLIESIAYSSGRKEAISKLVDIQGNEGWKQVLITTNPDDVAGLVRLTEVKSAVDGWGNLKGVTSVDSKASDKIKKEAAGIGGHVVLMLQNETKDVSFNTSAKSFKSGIAYGYPFNIMDSNLPYSGKLARRYYGTNKAEPKKEESKEVIGKKVLFENDGVITEGVIQKHYGNFYKIKWTRENGKETTTERHISKVEVASDK